VRCGPVVRIVPVVHIVSGSEEIAHAVEPVEDRPLVEDAEVQGRRGMWRKQPGSRLPLVVGELLLVPPAVVREYHREPFGR